MCLRVAYASGHLRGDISSSEPESSEPPSPLSRHVPAQLIYSPQPTNSQLLQILMQGTISALLGMPPSRTSSVGCSYRQYESDIDLHEADDRRRTREARGSTLPGFASLENVLPNPAAPFPSHHFTSSLPSVNCSGDRSRPCCPHRHGARSSHRHLSCAPCAPAVPPKTFITVAIPACAAGRPRRHRQTRLCRYERAQ